MYNTDDWPSACAFAPYIGNQAIKPLWFLFDHTIVNDTCFFLYDNHCHTHPLDDIALYSLWLACEKHLMHPHLPERAMCQFRLFQDLPQCMLLRHSAVEILMQYSMISIVIWY